MTGQNRRSRSQVTGYISRLVPDAKMDGRVARRRLAPRAQMCANVRAQLRLRESALRRGDDAPVNDIMIYDRARRTAERSLALLSNAKDTYYATRFPKGSRPCLSAGAQ